MSAIKLAASNTSKLYSTIGEIVEITEEGCALVDFLENSGAPILARSILEESASEALILPLKVSIVFENGDQSLPVITGLVRDTLFPSSKNETIGFDIADSGKNKHAKVDGKLVSFNADEEIQLNCGKSSIILKRNGKIVIKGAQVVSRSTGANKIKGSSVSIN